MSDMSTPRPWNMLDNDRRHHFGKDEDGDPSIVAYLAGGQRIASFARSNPPEDGGGYAALIVLAVNAHDDPWPRYGNGTIRRGHFNGALAEPPAFGSQTGPRMILFSSAPVRRLRGR